MKIGLSIKQKNILDSEIASFLASSSQERFDLVDDNNNYIFNRTVKKLAALADNE
ncbi:GAD-like domain protein, partial [Salmonella enterica subsp. enterica serovar Idikan]|nr:GAD-like domain protein [Salmonella enterica]EDA1261869.1 GAD-like domain protein [Salmonella enterica subsp. enterica serovar Idikan]